MTIRALRTQMLEVNGLNVIPETPNSSSSEPRQNPRRDFRRRLQQYLEDLERSIQAIRRLFTEFPENAQSEGGADGRAWAGFLVTAVFGLFDSDRSFKAFGNFGVVFHSTIVTPNAVFDYGYCHRTACQRLPYSTSNTFTHANRLCGEKSEGRKAGLESLNCLKLLDSSDVRGGESARSDENTLTVK
ncbi:hypothetical protein DFJ58DRAFT_848603 [Suillus subalutaceus]|uniref:uncharacterized protein n=1 Tax=Suillus subalutaceus TaxID=48586 RepID=UPI001B85D0A5|nr:uncharacterized protein DFJ58DRAFT_848603 [Suillus subalutaceus]KAG1829719.1 hypothetical protein DFJ58DRAFT_848603 [Suillus subalutaceus]